MRTWRIAEKFCHPVQQRSCLTTDIQASIVPTALWKRAFFYNAHVGIINLTLFKCPWPELAGEWPFHFVVLSRFGSVPYWKFHIKCFAKQNCIKMELPKHVFRTDKPDSHFVSLFLGSPPQKPSTQNIIKIDASLQNVSALVRQHTSMKKFCSGELFPWQKEYPYSHGKARCWRLLKLTLAFLQSFYSVERFVKEQSSNGSIHPPNISVLYCLVYPVNSQKALQDH